MRHSLTIYDDTVFYVQGFSNILLEKEIFSTVYQYNSQKEFIDHYKLQPTNYVIYGAHQKSVQEIIDHLQEITVNNKKVRIAVVGNYFDLNDIRKLFEKGIHCYLDKDTNFEEFLAAMKILKSQEIYICNSAKERMIGFISNQNQNLPNNSESLTKREIEVMHQICEGYSSKLISEKLFISINTVETHRKNILMKLNVKNSIGIVKYALVNNMLE